MVFLTYSYNMNEKTLNLIYTENIKTLRNKKGLSQAELADKINISEKYLSVLENGKKWGSFETLVAIANALDVEPYELLLPKSQSATYDTKRTRLLMKKLRANFTELVDTLEEYLGN